MRAPIAHLAAVALWMLVAFAGPVAADDARMAAEIEGKLMAPCCGANTVRQHDSGPAMQMRREIRAMVAEGRTEEEILDHYVAIHGATILAMPQPSGFNLLAYLLPGTALVVGSVLLVVLLRRWRREQPEIQPRTDLPEPEAAELSRVEKALRDLG